MVIRLQGSEICLEEPNVRRSAAIGTAARRKEALRTYLPSWAFCITPAPLCIAMTPTRGHCLRFERVTNESRPNRYLP